MKSITSDSQYQIPEIGTYLVPTEIFNLLVVKFLNDMKRNFANQNVISIFAWNSFSTLCIYLPISTSK